VGTTSARPTSGQSFRAIRRQLADALKERTGYEVGDGATLEALRITTGEPPRLARATPIEGSSIQRREVSDPDVGVVAFLDGIQSSRVVHYDGAAPIVHGSVAAVVRVRNDRRLTTWEHAAESRVYAPRGYLSVGINEKIDGLGETIVDTTPRAADGGIDADARHPLTLADVAVHAVQGHREALERRLAESWVGRADAGPLYIDGGISGSPALSSSLNAIGVVKSHRILYGDAAAIQTILDLAPGERSTAVSVDSSDRWRSTVASWYLRLHIADGHDPLWGLVRVEVAPLASNAAVAERANLISRWILAEVAPLSLPDGRWHTMVYGIRDCEQFLRSIQ
jgi:hypothetical protein